MAIQAISDLPPSRFESFVLRQDMPEFQDIKDALLKTYPNCIIAIVPGVTEGQACTAELGLDALRDSFPSGDLTPITFSACDNGVLFNSQAYQTLLDDPNIDVIVWGIRGHANAVRRPEMFGWINEKGSLIQNISVKAPLSCPATDPIVIGTFTFKSDVHAHAAIKSLFARTGRVNGEYYLDSCINDAIEMGLRCHFFEVESFISWGTPNDLRTFEYWQSCFHKWAHHPYKLELDSRVNLDQLEKLRARYEHQTVDLPK